jgi:hypothetical protein
LTAALHFVIGWRARTFTDIHRRNQGDPMNRHWQRFLIVLFFLALNFIPGYGRTRPKFVIGYASLISVATALWIIPSRGFLPRAGRMLKSFFTFGGQAALIGAKEISRHTSGHAWRGNFHPEIV